MAILKNDWTSELEQEFSKPYYLKLRRFLIDEYRTKTIFPDKYDIFNALHYTSLADTRVVILGQDPYHGPGQAHGLSFSVKEGVSTPPSLQNMFKELQDDLGCFIPNNGHLLTWTQQGVLLLNTVLTVRAHEANSHRNRGWESFTDKVIETVNRKSEPVVFLLWGSHAQKKAELITNPRHMIIRSPHPSPLSAHRGFFGSRPFSRTNAFLRKMGLQEIDWQIPNL
ncbi:uracil-DNA glycosylase [Paenibacillus woosongensis]|uniref:Uracil-DNA glycosylase n=1 Tax=Paenibacillus woosongensis TaxID=307580 RepID=A0AA95IBY2_9BACL|nr:uracil-DNA glycosylase [Paenibacillus woosongensis]WHX49323.1 uracil-DNA glycosylase [Paenibacillus woosongensis]